MSPELETYIEQHISPEPSYLKHIDRESNLYRINGRMCSGHIQGRLLKMLTTMISPERVIELGTFTGYSALCIAEGLKDGAELHTVEADDELEDQIRRNFQTSPHGNKIKLHIGGAMEIMEHFEENSFDMAVIDADKREYPGYFEKLMKLVRPGGYIIADNTLWDGHVTESGKHSAQTEGIMKFNDMAARCEGVETAVIPMRDGLTIVRKL